MTTKPKAKKFRIKRSNTSTPPGRSAAASSATPPETATRAPEVLPPTPSNPDQAGTSIDAIRKENLTGRQLRMARRVAQKQGLAPTSDFDAVRLLREQGIDPFQRNNMLELVVPKTDGDTMNPGPPQTEQSEAQPVAPPPPAAPEKQKVQLPQTVQLEKTQLPSAETLSPSVRREHEISQIQRDIMKRRRKKLGMLLVRLAFFVALPSIIAGYYYYGMATPMYATKSEFVIDQSEGAAGGAGGLLSGTQFATTTDSIATQSYLQSKDAMLRLDEDAGFKAHFTQDWIDPIQRLTSEPTNEEAYKVYAKNVKIGYDPTEGVIRMEVIAADPQIAKTFSEKLITYAEERINNLSQRKREDQMRDARESFENAVAERRAAQEQLVRLQLEGSTLDPEGVIASLRSQINSVELQLLEKELQLAALLDNARPNRARVEGARGDVDRLRNQLEQLNQKMVDANEGADSLAQLSVNIQMAQADLTTRDALLQSALQQMEQTRVEANRQVRYLTIAVQPVASEEASYPRAFENTILAFLIFAGIYLMVSLTASILREQVTS